MDLFMKGMLAGFISSIGRMRKRKLYKKNLKKRNVRIAKFLTDKGEGSREEYQQRLWSFWMAKGKWNVTKFRKFMNTALIDMSGVRGKFFQKIWKERAEQKEFRSHFTHRAWNEMHRHEVRAGLKERGLNRYGYPIHG